MSQDTKTEEDCSDGSAPGEPEVSTTTDSAYSSM